MPDWAKTNYLQEFPLNFPNIHMELDGLAVDERQFDESLAEVQADIDESLGKLRKWIGPTFNPRSSDQCKRLLWVLGYRDRDGKVESSDEVTMTMASDTHPLTALIAAEILNYRGLAKLRDTYLVKDKLWNGRLFYRINANGTDSGRLSSSESSFWCGLQIQNVPQGTAVKRWVRADDGDLIGENDFAQSEARCVGYMSGCQALIDLVESENDYHSWNAAAFFGVPYESIYSNALGQTLNKPLRNLSKRVNHGANYNMTKYMLLLTMGPKAVREARKTLNLPEKWTLLEVCDYLLSRYAKTYPEVKGAWYADIVRVIGMTKRLTGPTGWTRYFFGNPAKSKDAFNSAVAQGPQNLSAKILCCKAMMPIYRSMLFGELKGVFRLKANIHDSLLYTYKQTAEWVPQKVADMMRVSVEVRDIKGVKRTMVIPPDISAGKTHWSMLK
jgi:DNA polymerase-1